MSIDPEDDRDQENPIESEDYDKRDQEDWDSDPDWGP